MSISPAKFNIAFEKAKQVIQMLSNKHPRKDYIFLDEIVCAVKQISGFAEISITRHPFSGLELSKEVKSSTSLSCGAMLGVMTRFNPIENKRDRIAYLSVNAEQNATMQRFAIVHELGHLIMYTPNYSYWKVDNKKYTISTHVHDDITILSENERFSDQYLFAEQMSNIFAVLVLVPRNINIRDVKGHGMERLIKEFGVSEATIYSRMLLSSIFFESITSV